MRSVLEVTTREIIVAIWGRKPALHKFKTVEIANTTLSCVHKDCAVRDHGGEHTLAFVCVDEKYVMNVEAGGVQALGIDVDLPEYGPLTLVLDTSSEDVKFMAILRENSMATLLQP